MPAERFNFRNAQGLELAALLDRPDGPPRAVALFAHCFTCGKHNRAARRIAEGLKLQGVAVLRFDFTGLAPAKANSPTRRSPRMSTISSPPPITCGRRWSRPRS